MSLTEFAAYTANFNPGKTGIGQKAQMQHLQEGNYPKIKALPSGGKNSVKLMKTGNTVFIVECAGRSNIRGIKSFDAYDSSSNTLFMLKTLDIGIFSDNVGGGHQDNVRSEVETIIATTNGKVLSYKGKNVNISILINGRSADNLVKHCQSLLSVSTNIVIDNGNNQ